MTGSSGKPFLSVREAGELADFEPPLPGTPVDAAAVAHELIAIRSLAEMEERVLEVVRDATGAEWLTLYRSVDGKYCRRRTLQIEPGKLPDSLDAGVTSELIKARSPVDLREASWLEGHLPGAAACIRMQAEFEHLPVLLLLGTGEGDPTPSLSGFQDVIDVCSIALRNAELVERLQSEVFVDFLTSCYNRRAFEEHLTVEMVRARRYDRALCLLLLDLDDFKHVNDSQGHPQGDYVLQKVGETLRAAFRTTDRVCRFGGDEFAVIFPETSKADVLRLAERMRRQIAKTFPDQVVQSPVTASIGIACYPGDATRSDDLIRAADRALYRAKDRGRNQVVGS